MIRKTILLAALATAEAASAEEFGRIKAALDGEAREWFTIAMETDSGTAATATFGAGPMNTGNLHVQGHPRPSFTSTDVLSVDTMFLGTNGDAQQMDVSVMYMPDGMSGPYWQSDGAPGEASLMLETLEIGEAGDIGRASGRFEAEICLKESPAAPLDTTNCRRISGSFDTRVLME